MTELRSIARCALVLTGTIACACSHAQAPAAPNLTATSSAASDRAQKESDRTLYWIRVLAEKPVAPKGSVPKPVVAAPKETRPAASATAAAALPRPSEHVKVASFAPVGNSSTSSVATNTLGTSLRAADGAGRPGSRRTLPDLDIGVPMPATGNTVASTNEAPPLTPPAASAEVAEATEAGGSDPGLIMTKSVDPKFPMSTMRRLRKGQVQVRFEVGPGGQVDAVDVVETTNPGLNNAALDAVRQWQFKPTPHGHIAVVDLAFNLDS